MFHDYAAYVAQQLPYIWAPDNYEVYAVNAKPQGVTFNPLFTLLPECWCWTR